MTSSVYRFLCGAALASIAICAGCARDSDTSADAAAAPATQAQGDARYAAVARGRVDVEGGTLKLAMPVEGTLAKVWVHEGDQVARGQVLAALDASSAQAEDKIAAARLDQARSHETLLKQRLQQARTRAKRLTAAAQAGAGDGQSADDANDALVQAQAELDGAGAAARIAAAQREQAAFVLDRQTLKAPIDAEIARVSAQPGMSVSAHNG
ncbi:MAG: biotin/lipoyl-binding protein, partial [Lysobacter sp.]